MAELFVLALFIGGAFIVQQLLGYFQIKHFTKEFVKLRRIGKVAVGRKPGKFRAGTIVLFAINDAGQILQAKKLQGVTIMARMKDLAGFEGKNLRKLTDEDLSGYNKLLQGAIRDAVNNYETVLRGGTIQEKPSPLRSLMYKAENLVLKK